MKKILSLFFIATTLFLTSCSNNDVQSTQSFGASMVNRVVSSSASTSEAFTSTYVFELDYIAGTIKISAKDTKFNSRMPNISFSFDKMSLKTSSDNGFTFSATSSAVYDSNNTALSGYTVSDIHGQISGGINVIQYRVNDMYTVTASSASAVYSFSSTKVTDADSEFNWTDAEYFIDYDIANMKADVYLSNIKFASAMPYAINMVLNDVPVTPTVNGLKLETASIIPNIGNVSYPTYTITDFTADTYYNYASSTAFNGSSASFKFKCMGKDVNATATFIK